MASAEGQVSPGEPSSGAGVADPINHGQSLIDTLDLHPIILSARNIEQLWPMVHAEVLWYLTHHNSQAMLFKGRGRGTVDDLEDRTALDRSYRAPATPEEQFDMLFRRPDGVPWIEPHG